MSETNGVYSVGEDLAPRLIHLGIPVYLTSQKSQSILRIMDMTATILRLRNHYSVAQIDVYSGKAFLWAELSCWMLKKLRKPYFLVLRGGNLPGFAKKWPDRVSRLLNSCYNVAVPSDYLADLLSPYRDHFDLLPNPIDISKYEFSQRSLPRPSLIWLRSLHNIYNPYLVPKVIKLLLSDFPDIQMTMVGPDKGDGSLQETQRLASELGVQDRLQILGAVPKQEVPAILQRGDIFLNTTNFDNTPVSVLEAMACGLGVVSTNVGGLPYLLEHEVDSLLVPPDQPALMARAVQRLLDEPGLSARLTQNARRKVEQFDWEFVLPQWLEMIEKTRLQP